MMKSTKYNTNLSQIAPNVENLCKNGTIKVQPLKFMYVLLGLGPKFTHLVHFLLFFYKLKKDKQFYLINHQMQKR